MNVNPMLPQQLFGPGMAQGVDPLIMAAWEEALRARQTGAPVSAKAQPLPIQGGPGGFMDAASMARAGAPFTPSQPPYIAPPPEPGPAPFNVWDAIYGPPQGQVFQDATPVPGVDPMGEPGASPFWTQAAAPPNASVVPAQVQVSALPVGPDAQLQPTLVPGIEVPPMPGDASGMQPGVGAVANPQQAMVMAAAASGAGAPLVPGGSVPNAAVPGMPAGPNGEPAAPGIGQLLSQPGAPPAGAHPATPEEEQARLGAWAQFYEKVRSNPNLWLSLIKFGTEAVQPPGFGQNSLGQFGRAVQGGVDYFSALSDKQFRQGEEKRKLDSEIETQAQGREQSKASVKKIEADVKQTDVETQIKELDLKAKPELVKAQIDKMKNEGILDQARADNLRNQLEMFPEYREAVIEELNARARRNKAAAANETKTTGATIQRFKELKTAIKNQKLKANPKMDPGQAEDEATIEANQQMFAAGAMRPAQQQDAKAIYDTAVQQYKALKNSGDKRASKMEFVDWLNSEFLFDKDDKTKAAVLAQHNATSGQPEPGAKQRFGYDANGKLVPKEK